MTPRRAALLERLGIRPRAEDLIRGELEAELAALERTRRGEIVVLDAGCGRKSVISTFRGRIRRIVGADVHAPDRTPSWIDAFVRADMCGPADTFPEASFDLILSSFTLEHFREPDAALANFHRWLRADGALVASTVNRRHPWVRAYLGLPGPIRSRLQVLIKASPADAHPLVGACNDPETIRTALERAGFHGVRMQTVAHLARTWNRRLPAFLLGVLGDLITRPFPSRRSTIVVVAHA